MQSLFVNRPILLALFVVSLATFHSSEAAPARGLFEGDTDIGNTARPGAVVFDSTKGVYRVTGGGENMWFSNDAFHFVWKKVSGDATLAAEIAFAGAGGNAHRKACLLIRQDLEPHSAYADVAIHGDGLTSLQYRDTSGALTHEVQANFSGPRRARLEKRGETISMTLAREGEALHPSGASIRLQFKNPFYVGIGVCAHDNKVSEEALFSNVVLTEESAPRATVLLSTLETVTIASTDRRVVCWSTNLMEAPNWSRDGATLYFNSRGRIHPVPATGGEPGLLDTGSATRCNNDHGLSPDGTRLAISDQSQERRQSLIYILPVAGGTPRRITELGPSYWHGWSPDGKTLAYCGERNGEFDIYTTPAEGGKETRLTTATGLDDGPDYSPDGKWIYFNSERSGTMQIWRMHPDGSNQEAVTADNFNNWFPHPSPDGKWIVILSYDSSVKGHPENKDVRLRLLPVGGGPIRELARLFGGQGTINVPSWSPDSRKLAFVSYQFVP